MSAQVEKLKKLYKEMVKAGPRGKVASAARVTFEREVFEHAEALVDSADKLERLLERLKDIESQIKGNLRSSAPAYCFGFSMDVPDMRALRDVIHDAKATLFKLTSEE